MIHQEPALAHNHEICISRTDYVRHPMCKLLHQKTPYCAPEGKIESSSSYNKDYTCKYANSPVSKVCSLAHHILGYRVINKSSSGDEIPERDVTYRLICLLIYH